MAFDMQIISDNEELWLPVMGFEGLYSVSNLGRVRSEARAVQHPKGGEKHIRTRILKPSKTTHGYHDVYLCRDGSRNHGRIHKLVLEAFVGPKPSGFEACHGNGARDDNRLTNLRWDTRGANHADKIAHGTTLRGENGSNTKLTKSHVSEIRLSPLSQYRLAKIYGVSQSHIWRIKHRTRWQYEAAA